ncbi:testis-expressed sequence 2 protein-like protein [Lates japonicus]|uniref:Testis-expressed sequence 2 protein-like protein n=1 Tax=Lates japonicus TaxID=270547 RepID=A0AAD3R8H6_LATJO|nr:testis-expressed sequence 2 protein-like protein [Lates japonicus]
MPVIVLEAKDFTSPLFLVRTCEVLFSCTTFSLVASLESSEFNTSQSHTFRIFCMFTWCFFFTITLLIHILSVIQFHSLIPISWKNLTMTVAALGALMCLSASVVFPWIVIDHQRVSPRFVAAAVASCLTVLAYTSESYLLRTQAHEQRGYMGSMPGLLKILQLPLHTKPLEHHGHVKLDSSVGRCKSQAGLNGTEDTRLRLSASTAMTSQHPSHAESAHSTDKQPPAVAPKLHVQRSLSKETITIHFSAFGKEEEEEEEELYTTTVSTTSPTQDDSNIVTALEASEEMFEGAPSDSAAEVAVIPASSRLSPVSRHHTNSSLTQTPSLRIAEQKGSPTKSLSFPSSDKPFLSLVKSLSSDVESRDGVSSIPAPSVRHRHLMKTLVKSLSSDTSQDSPSSSTPYRLPESRLNLQLFKQFTQSRMPSATMSSAGDSKTAPSSPLTSPDNRSFFKVSDVEARIEDTKRRLSEVISEPLQLLSKIMDEKSGNIVGSSIYRPKALSVSASELSSIASFNGHLESNNNYCIKEEEGGDWEAESPNSGSSGPTESPVPSTVDTKSPNKSSSLSMSLDKCSMSALAKQEDEDFCILYSEDFETCTDTEASEHNFSSGAAQWGGGGDAVAWVNAARRVFWDFHAALLAGTGLQEDSDEAQQDTSSIVTNKMLEISTKNLDSNDSNSYVIILYSFCACGQVTRPLHYHITKHNQLVFRQQSSEESGAQFQHGLWFDLEISYRGSFLMTLETKMNLIRLGKEGDSLRLGEFGKDGYRPRTYCLADSDEESSSAGSSDEEDSSELSNDSAGAEGLVGGHKPSKIMRFVDKITKSKYFQKATETEFIKKKMEEVSNTPLLLTVEVQELQGTLAVNIPPPPTDRIWYGFRTPPHLELKARPKLGEREVTLAHVTDWIEKKLDQEFQKIFVMPNMDDVWLTIMHSAMDPRTAGGPLVGPSVDPEPSQPDRDSSSQP